MRARGLVGRVRVHLMDYRDLPAAFEHQFDAFVSIEMLEHVGSKVRCAFHLRRVPKFLTETQYYKRYFELVDFALKPAGATVVITSSTFPEGRYTGYQYVHPRPSRTHKGESR